MVLFPHAKINLGLQVVEKRHDGFHNIISCLYPIAWCDVLELLPSAEFSFRITGKAIPGDPQENLCVKAFQLLDAEYRIPPVMIHLHKVVPIGAGLGGGSSDAVFTLKGLRDMFALPLSDTDLGVYAAKLGSDCPFFLQNGPALATETGNVLSTMEVAIDSSHLLVVVPPVAVNTAQAYKLVTPRTPESDLRESLKLDISQWGSEVTNDFERPIFERYQEISNVKSILLANGASYASMSGSGSAVYGFFETAPDFHHWFPQDHLVWSEELISDNN